MTVLTDTQIVTASGGLVELGYAVAADTSTTATTAGTATTLATVTFVADGSPVLIEWNVGIVSPPVVASGLLNFVLNIDGSDVRTYWGSVRNDPQGTNYLDNSLSLRHRYTPSAGSHTVVVKAYVSSGTGIIHSGGVYGDALLRVSKIVQATQWPAVTTGTIICTSSTRPASPFVGQQIYETDTGRKYLYTGSTWVSDTPGLVLLNSTTVSSASSVSVDSLFSSTYDNYLIIPRVSGTLNSGLSMKLRSSGSDDSSANYSYQSLTGQSTSATATNSSSQTSWVVGSSYSINYPAQDILLVAPNLPARTSYRASFTQDGGSAIFYRTFAGDLATSTQYTGMTIYPASGGTFSGVIRTYGYSN